MRIMIKLSDYIRLKMVSNKINLKNLAIEGLEDLKIKFYSYLVFYHNYKNNYHEVYQYLSVSHGTVYHQEVAR